MYTAAFRDVISHSPISIPRAALYLAQGIAYPRLDVDYYLTLLDGFGGWGREMISRTTTIHQRVERLSAFLFEELGFQGNIQDYEDPRNSFLNEVIDRRLGIPITLSTIYMAVAESLGIPAQGIGLPGHFIVGIQSPGGMVYVDPFNEGKIISIEDCARLVQDTTGYEGPFQREWLAPIPAQAILTRMLNNLRNVYTHQQNWSEASRVLEYLAVLHPEALELQRDLGLVSEQNGALRTAVQYYEKYLTGRPEANDAGQILERLQEAAEKLARLN